MADSKVRRLKQLSTIASAPLTSCFFSSLHPRLASASSGSGPGQHGPQRMIHQLAVHSLPLHHNSLLRRPAPSFFPWQNVLNRMDAVEKRLAVETKKVDGPVGGADLREYQTKLLLKLRAIRGATSAVAFLPVCGGKRLMVGMLLLQTRCRRRARP